MRNFLLGLSICIAAYAVSPSGIVEAKEDNVYKLSDIAYQLDNNHDDRLHGISESDPLVTSYLYGQYLIKVIRKEENGIKSIQIMKYSKGASPYDGEFDLPMISVISSDQVIDQSSAFGKIAMELLNMNHKNVYDFLRNKIAFHNIDLQKLYGLSLGSKDMYYRSDSGTVSYDDVEFYLSDNSVACRYNESEYLFKDLNVDGVLDLVEKRVYIDRYSFQYKPVKLSKEKREHYNTLYKNKIKELIKSLGG